MKFVVPILTIALVGCTGYTSHDRWNDWSNRNNCKPTGESKILLAGSVYQTPQRRKVYKFKCDPGIVWSDLGNYAKHNEWLTIQ